MSITSFSLATIKGLLVVLTESILALFLLSGFSFVAYSEAKEIPEQEVEKAELVLQPEKGTWYLGDKPYSGYAIAHFSDGSIESRLGYWEGKKEGYAQKWHINGQVRYEAFYIANRLEGKARAWTSKGVLVKEANYVEGYTHGVQKHWYDEGEPFKVMNYNMGLEEGLQSAWRKNGALFINYEAKNGRFFGMKRANACYELKEEVIQF
ncbi:MAG: hypothetical protein AAFR87_00460 [Bacteroidota bacterium]